MYNVYFLFNGTHGLSLYMEELENTAYNSWQEAIPPLEAVEKNTYDRKTRVKLNSSRECVNEYSVDARQINACLSRGQLLIISFSFFFF